MQSPDVRLVTETKLASALATKVSTTRTVAGKPLVDDVILVKSDVGLSNVDNTADSGKPVSTAQQAALDLKVARSLARTTFSTRANGAYTSEDTGQAVTNTGSSQLTITGGVLTHTNTGSGSAGYAETNLGQKVGRVGATFQIPDITKSGTLALVLPSASWVSGGVGSSDAGCHFTITATAWAYQVTTSGSLVTLASGSLALAANSDLDVEIVLDGQTARVVLPDGRVVTVSDTRINTNVTTFAIIECFESTATTVPVKVSARRVDGILGSPLHPQAVTRIAAAAAAPSITSTAHVDYDTTVSGTVEVGGGNARVACTVPASGNLLARISSMLELQATDNVYAYPQFTYDAGGNVQGASVSAARATCFQRVTLEALLTGLTPGATGFIAWYTAKTGSATAIWHSGGLNGAGNSSAYPVK